MTGKQRDGYRTALRRLRSRLIQTGAARIEPNRQDEVAAGVSDEDAQALSEMLQVLASERNRGKSELLARIDGALRKVDSDPDEYGVCEECEEEIAPRRLALMPYAPLCAACQAKAEPRLGAPRRNLTDYR